MFGLEQVSSHAFDSLVFAEKQKGRWLAGSNNFRRTEQTDGPEEDARPEQVVHVAVSYAKDGKIALYRNGKPYGTPYRKDALHTFPAWDTRVLVGLRHSGAGRGFFAGTLREVRLYERALEPEEIAASHASGPFLPNIASPASPQAKAPAAASDGAPEALHTLNALKAKISHLRASLVKLAPAPEAEKASFPADAPENPLHLVFKAAGLSAPEFARYAHNYRTQMLAKIGEAKSFNSGRFRPAWELGGPGAADWFLNGPGVHRGTCGDFQVPPEGERALERLLPAGIGGSVLSEKLGGSATSPDFPVTAPNVSIRIGAVGGAMVQMVVDNYPLGFNGTFPKAVPNKPDPGWIRLDTNYRLGANGYLEVTTPDFQTRRAATPKSASAGAPPPPSFLVEKVVFHDGPEPPREEFPGLECLLGTCTASAPDAFLEQAGTLLGQAVEAWRQGTLGEAARALLDAAIQSRLLGTDGKEVPEITPLLGAYRQLEKNLPRPRMLPAVAEHTGRDAPFLARGDHKKPGSPVARRYLEVIDATPVPGPGSGREALAERLLSASNPLTPRVMANRIWHWTFGAGLVETVDNFGRMGEKPSHPELLDHLARRLRDEGWSLKKTLELLVTSEAFGRSSTPSEAARKTDPNNRLLSHARLRRLDAEQIRDAILYVSESLDPLLYGPSVAHSAPRRSIYLQQRRNSLPPFLAVFDAPKPFTTVGRRDSTNVPAQSLTLLNDPALHQTSEKWAQAAARTPAASVEERLNGMFLAALSRPASETELRLCKEMLEASGSASSLASVAHAIFNLKEFLYLR